jgi:RNA polymerase sigma factor (sigma-70 family)
MKSWNTLEEEGSYEKYLNGITRHKINDFFRQKYKFEIELPLTKEIEDSAIEKKLETDKRGLIITLLRKFVSRLEKIDQKIIYYKYQLNYTNNETATELGLTVNNIKVRSNRLIKKLKQQVAIFKLEE